MDRPMLGKALKILSLLIYSVMPEVYARFDTVPGSPYTAGRAAAMGDAYLQFADDGASALFYNPAALGKLRGTHFELLNIAPGINNAYLASSGLNFFKILNLENYKETLINNPNSNPGFSAQVAPNFYFRGFAAGALYKMQLSAKADGEGNITYRSKYQLIPAAGFGIRLAKGIVRLGYVLQWVNQTGGEVTTTEANATSFTENVPSGSGLSHNLGFALTLPIRFLPALNVAARNVGVLRYGSFSLYSPGSDTEGVPEDENTSYDVSLSLQPKLISPSYVNMAIQWRDLTNISSTSLFTRVVLGTEIGFANVFFLRFGWGSGYPSAGIGLRRPLADFSISWYSEELGQDYREVRDERFILHYQARIF